MSFLDWVRENRELAIAAAGVVAAIISLIASIIGRHRTTTIRHETITSSPIVGSSSPLSESSAPADEERDLFQMVVSALFCAIAAILFPLALGVLFSGIQQGKLLFFQGFFRVFSLNVPLDWQFFLDVTFYCG